MTVTAYPKDADGSNLQTQLTALQTQYNGLGSTANAAKAALLAKIDQLQRELVYHYLDTGRLLASNILSTMT